jgi:mRNA-degrading endonuclease toxin of MazEF toxin-antitoxin module
VEQFAVLQADGFNDALETLLVAPLDEAYPFYSRFPGAIPVSASEARAPTGKVLLVTQLACIATARFEPLRTAKLRRATLAKVDRILRLVLDLA